MSCTRCSKLHSTVQAFLLTCHGCNRKWHHRCHIPPVSDQELVSRIKAHNAGDEANSLQAWKCKRCTKSGTSSVSITPAPRASAGPSSNTQSHPISRSSSLRDTSTSESHQPPPLPPRVSVGSTRLSSKPATRVPITAPTRSASSSKIPDGEVILIDNSDSDTPQSKPSNPAKASTSEFRRAPAIPPSRRTTVTGAIKSTSLPSKPAHPLALEEEESSDSTQKLPLPPRRLSLSNQQPTSARVPNRSTSETDDDATVHSHSSRPRKKLASEDALGSGKRMTPSLPLSQEEKVVKREEYRRQAVETEKRKRAEHMRRQQEFIRTKSEERETQLARITTHVVDLTLDTEQPSPIRSKHPDPPLLASPEIVTATEVPADIATSPIIISTIKATDKEPQREPELDLVPQWIHRRKIDEDMWDSALAKKATPAPPRAPRRKFKAQKLGNVQPQIYCFSDIRWVEGMKRNQR